MPGEDFQMFEKDLPGHNKSGLSYQAPSEEMPLETCETMNGSWGFNITDNNYKSVKQLIHYIVNAAGLNTNFLLNIGPMPDGSVQPEFTDTLQAIGKWMQENGETIYGTRGNVIPQQKWGAVTRKDKIIYVHLLVQSPMKIIFSCQDLKEKIISTSTIGGKAKVNFKQQPEGVFIYLDGSEA
jgi:alpha-L-fucosidase